MYLVLLVKYQYLLKPWTFTIQAPPINKNKLSSADKALVTFHHNAPNSQVFMFLQQQALVKVQSM